MDTNNTPEEPPTATTGKKRYEKPMFRYEEVFVTSALTCGKLGTEATCQLQGHGSAS